MEAHLGGLHFLMRFNISLDIEIEYMVAHGFSTKEIADKLKISVEQVEEVKSNYVNRYKRDIIHDEYL